MKRLGEPDFVLGRETDDISERYDLGRVLGKGKFGLVRECTSKETGVTYACKTIYKFPRSDDNHQAPGMQDILDVEDVR